MFVDIVKIRIKAGKGGDGAVHFHREKYIAAGGPDGGDGGTGGNVVFVVDDHMNTLLDFRFKRKYVAENGEPGGIKNSFGKAGKDLLIKVPRGTLIKDSATGALMCDMSSTERFVAAKGGRGGWGNSHFATPTRQAPRFAKPGLEGDEREILLELKLIADVGLIGFPNVGKSTLLSMISKSRPKIANYHFTTLTPNLGVVFVDEGASFVCADIPGLIEGASEGVGLGHYFLRHVERCRLLVHLVDISGSEGRDPVEDFEVINRELEKYSPELAKRPQIIVCNKMDILENDDNLKRMKEKADELGYMLLELSAVTNSGTKELVYTVWNELEKLPPIPDFTPDFVEEMPEPDGERDISIEVEDGIYYIRGSWIEKVVASTNFGDYESRMYFERTLRKAGVFDMLEREGIEEKDIVDACGLQFEYIY